MECSATVKAQLASGGKIDVPAVWAWSIPTAAGNIANRMTVTLPQEYQVAPELKTEYDVTVAVAKAKLTITIDSFSRNEGEENSVFTYSVTAGTLAQGDELAAKATIVVQCDADASAGAGSYKITALASSDCYDITVIDGTLTVQKAKKGCGSSLGAHTLMGALLCVGAALLLLRKRKTAKAK